MNKVVLCGLTKASRSFFMPPCTCGLWIGFRRRGVIMRRRRVVLDHVAHPSHDPSCLPSTASSQGMRVTSTRHSEWWPLVKKSHGQRDFRLPHSSAVRFESINFDKKTGIAIRAVHRASVLFPRRKYRTKFNSILLMRFWQFLMLYLLQLLSSASRIQSNVSRAFYTCMSVVNIFFLSSLLSYGPCAWNKNINNIV